MPSVDDFLESCQSLLADAGVDLDLGLLRTIFWIVVVVVGGYAAYHLVTFTVKIMTALTGAVRQQIDQKFWRNAGKLATVVSFVLLVIAYGFYGREQTRTVAEAAIDLGREQLATVMPLAILTQWVLLCAFWVLFGVLLSVPWRQLAQPTQLLIGLVLLTVQLLLFTVALMSAIDGNVVLALVAFGSMFVATYLLGVAYSTSRARAASAQAMRTAGRPDGFRRFLMLGAGEQPMSRWRVLPGAIIFATGVFVILFGLIAAITAGIYLGLELDPPSLAGVIRGDLIGLSILVLFVFFRFRSDTLREPKVPPVLFHFIDLSLAVSAAVVALAGLSQSAVTLGPVPVWLVAIGPAVVVAAMVYTLHLRQRRADTPRWGACLAASVLAGLLAWPAKLLLTAALAPAVSLLPLPG